MPARPQRKSGRNVSKTKIVRPLAPTIPLESQISATIKSGTKVPFEIQQIILNVYRTAFPVLESPEVLQECIQRVKSHLYNRDFNAAFGESTNLEAYAARWSAARSLGYTSIFLSLDYDLLSRNASHPIVGNVLRADGNASSGGLDALGAPSIVNEEHSHIVCVGGGAGAEIVSLAAAYKQTQMQQKMVVTAVDIADWSEPVSKLTSAIYQAPKLSARTSEAAKARPENQPLICETDCIAISFLQQDVLEWDAEAIKQTLATASLCTIMFTLNELFSASLQKTTSFLLHLTHSMLPGTHLLIVDSPGSYSEIEFHSQNSDSPNKSNNEISKKKYPMKWLLDHTLLTVARNGEAPVWEKLEDDESLWFRLDPKDREKLRYPVELENMRYQLHLYRKL